MSGETFAVGEVAVYVRAESDRYGAEVTIRGPLEYRRWQDDVDGKSYGGMCYHVGFSDIADDWLIAEPHELRKRRPPQDWAKLCRLDERPVEEPA